MLTRDKNEKIRVTLCENAAGALYIVNNGITCFSIADARKKRHSFYRESAYCC